MDKRSSRDSRDSHDSRRAHTAKRYVTNRFVIPTEAAGLVEVTLLFPDGERYDPFAILQEFRRHHGGALPQDVIAMKET